MKSRCRQFSTITEWVQCYSIYVAVLAAKHPEKIQDLMGYQALIVEACAEYKNEAWLGYDQRFRQMASASPSIPWAKINPTLRNMAFTGQAKAQSCKYCFRLTHMSEECDWAPFTAVPLVAIPASFPARTPEIHHTQFPDRGSHNGQSRWLRRLPHQDARQMEERRLPGVHQSTTQRSGITLRQVGVNTRTQSAVTRMKARRTKKPDYLHVSHYSYSLVNYKINVRS